METWAIYAQKYTFSLNSLLLYFFQNVFCKICVFKECANSYFHTRGHVPDDLILKACRNGTFVFKLQAPKICSMKAWKRNNRTSSRAKIEILWRFWLPQVSNWLVRYWYVYKCCCIYEPYIHIWGGRYASHPFWAHQLLGCHFLQAWQLMSFVQTCLDC